MQPPNRNNDFLFVDPTFPREGVLCGAEWKRPQEICDRPQFIIDGTSRMDVCQGKIANCWFLSAVTSLTLHKHLMDKVVPPEQGFDAGYNGKFTFRFWQYGDWQEVEVDDLLPTVDGKLLYLHSGERNEFWSALLEKAYAKLKGGYHNLHVGYPHEAMTDMTGGVTEIFHQENIPADFVRFLRQQLDRGSLVNCASSQGGFEQLSRSGILFQHAYAVTGMEQVQTPEGKVDLVRVRNPWGNTEWNGAWSDEHGEWDRISPAEQNRLQRVKLEDGEFWMSVQDFQKIFNELEVCHLASSSLSDAGSNVRPWTCTMHNGRWVKGISSGGPPQAWGNFPGYSQSPVCRSYWLNPQFRLRLLEEDDDPNDTEKACSFLLSLMQKHGRRLGAPLSIGIHIYQVSPQQAYLSPADLTSSRPILMVPSYCDRQEVVLRGRLAPGEYIIIPSTALPDQEREFLLRVFTEKGNWVNTADKASSEKSVQTVVPLLSKALPTVDAANELFTKFASAEGRCGAVQLQALLREAVQGGVLSGTAELFSVERCKTLVSQVDKHGFGQLDTEDFKALWEKLRRWTDIFVTFDKNQSRSLDYPEIIVALQAAGLQVDDFVLQLIGVRYTEPDLTVSYPAFLCFMLKLDTMIRKFQSLDQLGTGIVSLNYRQWLHLTMYS
ncbi:calpain-1 catalytic subunit [Polypterus senegalus]|nr:calpain-1 catalytic subunit [Polypterus senegalus]